MPPLSDQVALFMLFILFLSCAILAVGSFVAWAMIEWEDRRAMGRRIARRSI